VFVAGGADTGGDSGEPEQAATTIPTTTRLNAASEILQGVDEATMRSMLGWTPNQQRPV
jgi:hypothetical protein